MNRNILYIVIGVLAIATAILAYQSYQANRKPAGVDISIGERGITIEKR